MPPEPCCALTPLSSALPSDRDLKTVVSRLLSVGSQLRLGSGSPGGGLWGVDTSRAWAATWTASLVVSGSPLLTGQLCSCVSFPQLLELMTLAPSFAPIGAKLPALVAIPCSCQPMGCLTVPCLASQLSHHGVTSILHSNLSLSLSELYYSSFSFLHWVLTETNTIW